MGFKIIMTICMLPVLPILYGAMRFCAGEKRGILYGVTLWVGARAAGAKDTEGISERAEPMGACVPAPVLADAGYRT